MNRKTSITILTILGLAIIVGGFWYVQNQQKENVVIKMEQEQNQQMNNEKERKQENNKTETVNDFMEIKNINYNLSEYKNWNIYRNKNYEFEIKYPSTWEYEEYREGVKIGEEDLLHKKVNMITFGTPESFQGGHICNISFHSKNKDIEKNIAQIGNQFNDRQEQREKVKFNDINGLLVTVKANSRPNWISKHVYFFKKNMLFIIGCSNYEFEKFYSSFKFIK